MMVNYWKLSFVSTVASALKKCRHVGRLLQSKVYFIGISAFLALFLMYRFMVILESTKSVYCMHFHPVFMKYEI